MTYDQNNIFARILRKEIPAQVVYENDYALAFYDINPQAPLHILVIPKGEYGDFSDFASKASSHEIMEFTKAIQAVIHQVNLEEKGFRILSNQGLDGGQEVPHYHVHILGGRPLGPMIQKENPQD